MSKLIRTTLSIIFLASLVLAGCTTAAPQTIIQTV